MLLQMYFKLKLSGEGVDKISGDVGYDRIIGDPNFSSVLTSGEDICL
jgi:hypothetical protein